jgi:hypothetical protein
MAEHHMADPVWRNPGPIQRSAGGNRGKLDGRDGGKCAAEGADRRAGRGQDHDLAGVGHGQSSLFGHSMMRGCASDQPDMGLRGA